MIPRTLIQASQDQVALLELVQESEGELTPELETWLAEIDQNLATKLDHYVYVMDQLDANAESVEARAKELAQAAKSIRAVKEKMKERIKNAMGLLQTNELKGDTFRFKLSDSAPRVIVDNEITLPLTFQREVVSWEVDKRAIKESFDKGNPVEGCHLEQGQTLKSYVNKESRLESSK